MSALLTRIFILGFCFVLSAVFGYYDVWVLSHYFIGMVGLFLGIIGMKEKDKMKMFADIAGVKVDMGDLEDATKKEGLQSKRKKKKKL